MRLINGRKYGYRNYLKGRRTILEGAGELAWWKTAGSVLNRNLID